MNYNQATLIIGLYEELQREIRSKVPEILDIGKRDYRGNPLNFGLDEIDLENMQLKYSRYIGCGESEYETRPLDLETLLGY